MERLFFEGKFDINYILSEPDKALTKFTIDERDIIGNTILHYLCALDYDIILNRVLELNPNPLIVNKRKEIPLDYLNRYISDYKRKTQRVSTTEGSINTQYYIKSMIQKLEKNKTILENYTLKYIKNKVCKMVFELNSLPDDEILRIVRENFNNRLLSLIESDLNEIIRKCKISIEY